MPAFAYFNGDEFTRFNKLFEADKQEISLIIEKLVLAVYEGYKKCIPERLHPQITGVLGGYLNSLVGFAVNELQARDILAPISENSTLTANIMYIKNDT